MTEDQDWAESLLDWKAWLAWNPVMAKLFEARVFSVGLLQDGGVLFVEECDSYFSCRLSPDEIRQLANELTLLAELSEAETRRRKTAPT